MEKIESNIKTAETIINESHFLAHSIRVFSRAQVIELIKNANRQAIKISLQVADEHNTNQIEIGESPDFENLINAFELKVT